jgi:hypothetical protein
MWNPLRRASAPQLVRAGPSETGLHDLLAQTPYGELVLAGPSHADVHALFHAWPMGLQQGDEIKCGLFFEDLEGNEQHGVKMQPPDCTDRDTAEMWMAQHRAVIALALQTYIAWGFEGIMLPCPYLREKDGSFESGIAFFPVPRGADAGRADPTLAMRDVDEKLGTGASAMIVKMIQAIKQAMDQVGRPMYTCLGLDLRPRLALGSILLEFLVLGKTVYCLRTKPMPDDPVWGMLTAGGTHRVVRMPAIPAKQLPH